MQERKIVRRYDLFLRAKQYLVVEGYNPRIHAVYLCPQLYKCDSNQKLAALKGEEIGQIIAHSLSNRVAERRPWYEPSEKLPVEPIIGTQPLTAFDTVVVDMPPAGAGMINDVRALREPGALATAASLSCPSRCSEISRSAPRLLASMARSAPVAALPASLDAGQMWRPGRIPGECQVIAG